MNQVYLTQMNTAKDDEKKKITLPKSDEIPVGASEKLAREEVRKLTQNAEEIRKLREQVGKKATEEEKE